MNFSFYNPHRDILFEYHRAVVPFCWAVRPVEVYYKVDRLLTGIIAQQKGTTARWYSNKISLCVTL